MVRCRRLHLHPLLVFASGGKLVGRKPYGMAAHVLVHTAGAPAAGRLLDRASQAGLCVCARACVCAHPFKKLAMSVRRHTKVHSDGEG